MKTPDENPDLSSLERIAYQIDEINAILSEENMGSEELKLDLENSLDIDLLLKEILRLTYVLHERYKEALGYTYGSSYKATYNYYRRLYEAGMEFTNLIGNYFESIMNNTSIMDTTKFDMIKKISELFGDIASFADRKIRWAYDGAYPL